MNGKLEKLAELEHKQWISWTKGLLNELEPGEVLSKKRVVRWKELWTAYKNLSDKSKEFDRKWARKVIQLLKKK